MTLISIDVEADGPCPGLYSMVSFGAVIIEEELTKTFYGRVKPISEDWIPEALAVSNTTREEHLTYDDPAEVMIAFAEWIKEHSKHDNWSTMISDNPAFDWQWINYYFHKYYKSNPLGFSARRIGDIYCGIKKDMTVNREWKKKYRDHENFPHNHHPVSDACGNASALLRFRELGLIKI